LPLPARTVACTAAAASAATGIRAAAATPPSNAVLAQLAAGKACYRIVLDADFD